MTDQPTTYSMTDGSTLTIDAARGWGKPEHVSIQIECGCLDPLSDEPGHLLSMFVPTARLLAMIDLEDPDAMRAYLRETAPEVIADLYRPEIPEADSPEDVDERRHFDPLTAEQLADLRDAGRTLGEAWRTFGAAVREGMQR